MKIVKNICDNPNCGKDIIEYRTRVVHEYSSRSIYSREYCSKYCAVDDMDNFQKITERKDMSS